ncbi:nitroreductase, partial [bacterium]|nr:nitroreductase [bacterium]
MNEILLPELEDIDFSIFKSIKNRKSVRDYKKLPFTLKEVSYLLWSAKSIPSAGGLYPLKFYLFSKNVIDLDIGLYKYEYNQNKLIKIFDKDVSNE